MIASGPVSTSPARGPRPRGRACGAHRAPGRRSRWKRTPRTRGVFLAATTQQVGTGRAPTGGPWRLAADAAGAGLALAAGLATWGLTFSLLVF
jgi:hypothetical protein